MDLNTYIDMVALFGTMFIVLILGAIVLLKLLEKRFILYETDLSEDLDIRSVSKQYPPKKET